MSYQRLAYDDHDTAARRSADAAACVARMDLPGRRDPLTAPSPATPRTWAELAAAKPAGRIEVSEAAAHLAAKLY